MRLVNHARGLIVAHAAWITWYAWTLPNNDRVTFLRALSIAVLVTAFAAACWPRRGTLLWLGLVTAWCIIRAGMLMVIGSSSLSGPGTELRAAVGWLLWVPALTLIAAVSRTASQEGARWHG